MARPKSKTSNRLNAELPEGTWEKLHHLVEREGDSYTYVVKSAINTYHFLATELKDGARLQVEYPDGTKKILMLPGISW